MKFEQKSYVGDEATRPTPEIYFDENQKVLFIITPWGAKTVAQQALEIIQDYFFSAKTDKEATSPFPRLDSLSPICNNLRIAALLANEAILREKNKEIYTSACEITLCYLKDGEFHLAHVGQPFVFVFKSGLGVIPISPGNDLSTELNEKNKPIPPLPCRLIGTCRDPNIFTQSFHIHEDDALIFLSKSVLNNKFLSLSGKKISLKKMSDSLNSEDPYWIGMLTNS